MQAPVKEVLKSGIAKGSDTQGRLFTCSLLIIEQKKNKHLLRLDSIEYLPQSPYGQCLEKIQP